MKTESMTTIDAASEESAKVQTKGEAKERSGMAIAAAGGGLLATLVTGIACVGPLVAILLGIGGFGWLTQYAYLRVPATVATAVALGFGFYWVYFRKPPSPECAKKKAKQRRMARVLLWVATVLAVAINVFEYLIFPNLA